MPLSSITESEDEEPVVPEGNESAAARDSAVVVSMVRDGAGRWGNEVEAYTIACVCENRAREIEIERDREREIDR